MNANSLSFIMLCVMFLKFLFLVISFLVGGFDFFGGGNDSDYYDAYALGINNNALNMWPVMLSKMADMGFYSRKVVSFSLQFISLFMVPYLVSLLSSVKGSDVQEKSFLYLFFMISMYPNLFYLSLDIYSDMFMVFLFLLGLFVFKNMSEKPFSLSTVFLFLLGLGFTYILYKFRPYLGLGYGAALLFSSLYSFKKYNHFFVFLLLLIALQGFYFFGLFDSMLEYSTLFIDELQGGSNLGVDFSNRSFFLLSFFKSAMYQVFGFNFMNLPSVLAFLLESLPFIVAFIYLLNNKSFSNKFMDYLIVFFVVYSIVWLLGNDNMGSATRLSMFNYIVMYMSCFIVYQNKNLSANGKLV